MTKIVVGIDVGKAKLDVAITTDKRVRVWTNDDAGRVELVEWVVSQEASLVVVEASGGYEAAVVSALVERGLAVSLVNPTRVRSFARAAGILAKTDKIDAGVIARFGATMEPSCRARREARSPWMSRSLAVANW